MAAPVKNLVAAALPAETVREIGLRLRDVVVSQFDNAQQMGRAAAHAESGLVILSDAMPVEDAIYIARRAKDASDEMKVVFFISMLQAENALHALKDIEIDRFFLAPIDTGEMLHELAKMCRVEVVPAQASHGEHIAAAVLEAWDRTRPTVFQKVDKLDDAAIALLENNFSPDQKSAAERDAHDIAGIADRFGFKPAARTATELAERFASQSLSGVDGVAISEQLLALRQSLLGAPATPSPVARPSSIPTPGNAGGSFEESQLEGR